MNRNLELIIKPKAIKGKCIGCKGFKERAKERAKDIIRNHKPNPLPDDIGKALDELVSDALRLMEK